jgi:hypothetical protein
VAGSLFYFGAYRREGVSGLFQPFLVLGAPFIGLNAIARYGPWPSRSTWRASRCCRSS